MKPVKSNIMARLMILLTMSMFQTLRAATATFDGGVTYQTIDGFGANINHRSWNNDELKPVLDALIDQAGMTLFRVVYDEANWETNNDNGDPNVINWDYYAPLYSNGEFTKLWDLVGYLNGKGITTNGVIFNLMGPGPAWMGGGSLADGQESEWAEMITSLLLWARYTNGLQFTYVGPDNEPDIANEGITISSASQYVTALRALAQQLDANGLSDLRFVGPDLAYGGTTYMPEMMADPVVMGKLAHFGVHSYSSEGGGSSGVYDFIQGSDYPDRTFWMTEFNVWCSTCDSGTRGTYDWAYCEGTANYLLSHLANGASGGTVWEGYDSFYLHPPTAWSYWGLFSVDDENVTPKTYTARKNFYTLAQISKFVRPGAQRIQVNGSTSSLSPLLAFKHSGLGQITVVGINTSGNAATLSGTLTSLPAVPYLYLYYTSDTTNLAYAGTAAVTNGTFRATIPADCVFTLASFTGTSPTLTAVVVSNQVHLTLSGQPGKTYTIEYSTNQVGNAPWFFMADISLTTPCLELGSLGTNGVTLFYRTVEATNNPRLIATVSTNQVRKLTLCGEPGKTYGVEYKTDVAVATPWVFLEELAQTNYCQELSNNGPSAPMIFYRGYEKVPSRLLQMSRKGANYVIEWPAAYLVCGLEEATTFGPEATWLPSVAVIQQFGDKLRATVPVGTTSKFYRLRCSQ